jgi:hypothetical protein
LRSKRGVLATVVTLLALPAAVMATQLGVGEEVSVHWSFAVGFALLAVAVFDFKTPRWITWMGCLSIAALSVVFFLQGLNGLVVDATLRYVAYDLLGQSIEGVLVDLFLIWCFAVLLFDSQGTTRIVGMIVLPFIAVVEIHRYIVRFLGEQPTSITLLVFLLAIGWLLLESMKTVSPQAKSEPTFRPSS